MAVNTGTDFDIILTAVDKDNVVLDLTSSDILFYGVIIFESDGTEIARFSTNGDTLGAPWKASNQIEGSDLVNGKFLVHMDKDDTVGLITQTITARILIQRDATINLDDKHDDNRHWQAGEDEILQIVGSKDDTVVTMIP